MNKWIEKGLRTGVVTTPYPKGRDEAAGISPGLPDAGAEVQDDNNTIASRCPTDALQPTDGPIKVDQRRCIHCFRCVRNAGEPFPWDSGFEWASLMSEASVFPPSFRRSLHIRVIDAGDCGACLNEVKLLNNPYYNMHRLGFFITPTPRQADVLLVIGPVADHMKIPLLKAYEAMPDPKRVMAVGVCALSGGVFRSGFIVGSGVSDLIPVDVEVPGCPPPPLAILHGLLVLAGRSEPHQFIEPANPVEGGVR